MTHTKSSFTATEKWTLLATILASSLVFIDGSALNVALATLQKDLSISGTELLWVVNGYALFLSSLLLLGGSLGDIYGRNKVFLIGLTIFSLSSFACGMSQTALQLITGRCFQGIGGALLTPGSLSILSAQFGKNKRGKAIGLWSTFSALTGLIGPILGGWLASMGLWRVIFLLNIPLSLLVIFAIVRKVPETKNEKAPKLDIWGAIMVTLGLAGLTYGFTESPKLGFDHISIITSLVSGVVFLFLFILIQKKISNPMMPLGLFKSRIFSSANLLTLFVYASLGGIMFFIPLNLIQVQGYSERYAGLSMLPVIILISSISPLMGKYVDRNGPRYPLIIGPLIIGTGFFLFSIVDITNGAQDYWVTFFPGFLLLGLGLGISVAPLTTAVMGSVSESSVGIASGVNNTVARTAGVLAIALMGALVLFSFQGQIHDEVINMGFDKEIEQSIILESSKLGATEPPAGLSIKDKNSISKLIQKAFIVSFNRVVYVGTIMTWVGALMAFIFIKTGRNQ